MMHDGSHVTVCEEWTLRDQQFLSKGGSTLKVQKIKYLSRLGPEWSPISIQTLLQSRETSEENINSMLPEHSNHRQSVDREYDIWTLVLGSIRGARTSSLCDAYADADSMLDASQCEHLQYTRLTLYKPDKPRSCCYQLFINRWLSYAGILHIQIVNPASFFFLNLWCFHGARKYRRIGYVVILYASMLNTTRAKNLSLCRWFIKWKR